MITLWVDVRRHPPLCLRKLQSTLMLCLNVHLSRYIWLALAWKARGIPRGLAQPFNLWLPVCFLSLLQSTDVWSQPKYATNILTEYRWVVGEGSHPKPAKFTSGLGKCAVLWHCLNKQSCRPVARRMVLLIFSLEDATFTVSIKNLRFWLTRPPSIFFCLSGQKMTTGQLSISPQSVLIKLGPSRVPRSVQFVYFFHWPWFTNVFLSPCSDYYREQCLSLMQ